MRKLTYQTPTIDWRNIAEDDVIRTSPGGYQDGDNDLSWTPGA